MSNAFTRNVGLPVPQTEKAHPLQQQNNAGGYSFVVSNAERLRRFLILGVDGGTYYVGEKKLTKDNVEFLRLMIEASEESERDVIDIVRDVSIAGRAYRNSPAIFAVAALFAYGKLKPRELVRDVCRTATHLFEFAQYVELLGGWGPSKRKAVADWYAVKRPRDIAYQAVKYRQRNGWTHRDLLRLAHPQAQFGEGVGEFILGKEYDGTVPEIISGFRMIQSQTELKQVLNNLDMWPELPWEAIPTQFLKEPEVWKKLFYNGQLKGQALVRNITRLARIGAFKDMVFAGDYAKRLVDRDMIKSTRLHPMQYLLAMKVHQDGQFDRRNPHYVSTYRSKDWESSPVILDALDAGFTLAFNYVEPANKRTYLGLDVSGSMTGNVCGIDLTASELSAAMAMTIMRTEPYHVVYGFSDGMRDLRISGSMNLNSVLATVRNVTFGRTDCALPMLHALEKKIEVDTFVVLTDNETWYGRTHPHTALEQYRQKMGIGAKLIVVACTPTQFSIANPNDAGMLDVVGADSNLPSLVANFSKGF